MRIGPYNILFVEEIEECFSKSGQRLRRGKFLCPYHEEGDDHFFEARVRQVVCGKSHHCGCQTLNLVNYKFGKLTVEKQLPSVNKARMWLCRCECGGIKHLSTAEINASKTLSCGCLKSKGELLIGQLLTKLNIDYIKEYSFNKQCINPRTNKVFHFDFYLPNYNCCIEYDGEQHYTGWSHKEASLKINQERDYLKTQYCLDHSVKLIRIPYYNYDMLTEEYLLDLITRS